MHIADFVAQVHVCDLLRDKLGRSVEVKTGASVCRRIRRISCLTLIVDHMLVKFRKVEVLQVPLPLLQVLHTHIKKLYLIS